LFERIVVASGTSNRQTKALAASVRDAVREAGFPKPRMEGEDNGEWIIVDCGQAVVHVMQPNIRQYYHLEDLWGDKPVRLKFGADKPAKATEAKPEPASKPAGSMKRSSAAKKGVMEAFPSKAQMKKDAEKTARKSPARKTSAQPAAKKVAAKKAPAKSAARVTKVTVGKPAAKKSAPKAAPKAASKTASRKS
jgi:ribosome-associated protein